LVGITNGDLSVTSIEDAIKHKNKFNAMTVKVLESLSVWVIDVNFYIKKGNLDARSGRKNQTRNK
jgi:hypothetical protein